MGKDEKKKKERALNIAPARTIRENGKASVNPSGLAHGCTLQKMKHLQRLAVWASGKKSIPPLGALLGSRLAAVGEVSGIPPLDSPFFTCERCETILQPGFNCSVRLLKLPRKARHKPRIFSKSANVVVYTCNHCTHKNMKPGTPKDYVKKLKPLPCIAKKQNSAKNVVSKHAKQRVAESCILASNAPVSTLPASTSENISSTRKRKRKNRPALKELSQKPPTFSNLTALKIPDFRRA